MTDEEKKEGENVVKEAIVAGPHIEAPSEIVAQLSPELQAAVKAGAPIIMFVNPEHGVLKVVKTRTFETSYAISHRSKLSLEEIELLQTEHSHLIESWRALEEQVRKSDSDCQKALRQKNELEDQLRKKRNQLNEIRDGLRVIYEKYKV